MRTSNGTEESTTDLFCRNSKYRFNGSNTFWTIKISFETVVVRANEVDESARSGGIIRISLVSNKMKVCCVFSSESPQWGDSNENTQDTIFNIRKENHPKLSQICRYGIFSKGLKNKFETAVINELSVFEPLKFYCI